MIVGIGTDLADIGYFRQCLLDPKTCVIEKTFTAQEIATSQQGPVETAARLAARFAAKEAFFKALSQTMLHRLSSEPFTFDPREVEVCLDGAGRPFFSFSSKVAQENQNRGVKTAWLSLSHEGEMATAMVVLEG